jgi:hypothetical protein
VSFGPKNFGSVEPARGVIVPSAERPLLNVIVVGSVEHGGIDNLYTAANAMRSPKVKLQFDLGIAVFPAYFVAVEKNPRVKYRRRAIA